MAKSALAALVALSAALAGAQDFNQLKGDTGKTGKNTLPATSGPGVANLRWFSPNANDFQQGISLIRDNLSLSQTSFLGTWTIPAPENEASFSFYPTFLNPLENTYSGYDILQLDFQAGIYPPAYRYATTIPSAVGSDPTIKQNPGDPSAVYTWNLQPADPAQRISRAYALYAWLPSGPTYDPGLGANRFPQRYYVYEILYGDNQRWIDVVDTFVAGTGWVRLGGGGRPTNRLFSYNGTDPIQIRLHNTVPRNENGTLSDVPYQTIVYADAVRAIPDFGSYTASPVISALDPLVPGSPVRTVAAMNEKSVGVREGEPVTVEAGKVSSFDFDTGVRRWSYSPVVESENAIDIDNTSASVTPQLPWATATTAQNYKGTNYHQCLIDINDPVSAPAMAYAPTLEDGNYEIYAWLPGSNNGILFGRAVQYEIHEGGTVSTFQVDQDAPRGWVRIGTRRYNHDQANARLRVFVTNYSGNPADSGRFAYADTIRFVGATDIAITATPIQTKAFVNIPGLGVVERAVVVVAAENGRIYCLDATGNGDGTTNVIWTYPSTPDANTTDPNAASNEDGGVAEMPTGFGLSSPTIARVDGKDYLYIASANGRVYCIEMEGRGDADFAARKPGTTRRKFSYPDDFPATPRSSNLGAFRGSVVFADTAQGPTIFAPTTQGRLYALDARGTTQKRTTPRWTFPALTSPTLGSIESTPAIEFGKIFFGTTVKSGDDRGRFYALNVDTGATDWEFNGTTAWSQGSGAFIPADDFISGATTASSTLVGSAEDCVFVANENRYISALDAANGNLLWTTQELSVGVLGNLTFTTMRALNNAGAPVDTSVVMVPTADGRFVGLYANAAQTNRFGTRRCYEYRAAGDSTTASIAVGRNWMSAVDSAGYLYNFNNGSGVISPGIVPGDQVVVENNRVGDIWRETEIKLVDKATYQKLRLPDGSAQLPTYAQMKALAEYTRPDNAWDWGETMYILVYKFPYARASNQLPPPIINYAFSVEGTNIRNISIESRKFKTGPGQDTVTDPISGDVYDLDGFAVLSFTFQGGGSNSLPPGIGAVQVSINSSLTGSTINIVPNPLKSKRQFRIANPIALVMKSLGNGNPDPMRSLGYTAVPGDPENLMNGSQDISSTVKVESRMGATEGMVAHSRAGNVAIGIVDRSMMTLLRGPGRGLDNIRVARTDLQWTGGSTRVVKPIDFTTFPNYEDLPINFPNDSLDYPDIRRENLRVTKDPNGSAENPLFNAVILNAPLNVDENNPFARTLVPTPFQLSVDVPLYQPANVGTALDSGGTALDAGYFANLEVYVDSNGDGRRSRTGTNREAYRSFFLGTSVPIDESIEVTTPTVNLGSMAGGTGYDPRAPWLGTTYSPYSGPYSGTFQPFVVRNTGNTNMLNLRVAKGTDVGGASSPWEIYSLGNSDRAWLDGGLHLHSDIDTQFAVPPSVLLQKPRVDDRVPTELSINPVRRENANLGISGNALDPANWFAPNGPAPRAPRISVSVPLGFPAGEYSSVIRVIEDRNNNQSLLLDGNGNGAEPYSDPGFVLNFKVRETRLTNSYTQNTAPMIDDPSVLGTGGNYQHDNSAPSMVRDLGGNIAVAFASPRSAFTAPQPNAPPTAAMNRIYVAGLQGTTPAGGLGTSPLRDLNGFTPANNNQWFSPQVGPYPTQPLDTLFDSQAGENVIPETARFGFPAFPALGFANPYSGGTTNSVYMAFIGNAQKQKPSRRSEESRLFIAEYQNGNLTAPIGLPFDPEISKGKPSVVQVGSRATVFYTSGGTGQPQIHFAAFDGANWNAPSRIDVGTGFESLSMPSAYPRVYEGASYPNAGTNLTAGTPIIELAFSGKLIGRPHSDIWLSRIVVNGNGVPRATAYFPERVQESLESTGEAGLYRTRGVVFNPNAQILLQQDLNGTVTNLELPGTRIRNTDTGIYSFNSALGGKVYVDPAMGTVRFSGTSPAQNARILLTYTAKFLRVTGSGATATQVYPSLVFDNRLIGDFSYWARNNNSGIQPSDQVRPGRFVLTYGRAAAGAGQAARPFMQSFRLTVALPTSIHTQSNGTVTSIQVSGATSFYQVDPANGRVYFTDADEARNVIITYTGADATTGAPIPNIQVQGMVQLKTERLEAPVPIEQAVNESQLSMFLDPFDNVNPANRRPGLLWMLWSSTRSAGPDIYLQTIAPRFTPLAGNR